MSNQKNHQKIIFPLVVVAVLTGSAAGFYWLGTQHAMKATTVTEAIHKTEALERKPLYWHDPMSPTQKFDKPGKSPFMDMQLVPVYAANANDSGAESKVNVSARVQQNLGIRTAEVIKTGAPSTWTAIGNVAYNERDMALVQARSNGFVEKLFVRAPSDRVHKGQALAELYVPDWIAAQEEYLTVKRMTGTRTDGLLDGARQRMRLVGMTDDQIRLVESTGKVHSRITITSPVSGVVAELAVREGATVAAGSALFRINGLNTVWVNAEVPENITAHLRPGTAVEARIPALQGAAVKGKISAILPEVNAATRTLKARIELANPGEKIVPGMFANLSFVSDTHKEMLTVPSESIIQTGTRSVVMLAQGDGKFTPVDVETGSESNGQTEIKSGLTAGQKVVVSGQFLIDSEASLKASTTRMSDARSGEVKDDTKQEAKK